MQIRDAFICSSLIVMTGCATTPLRIVDLASDFLATACTKPSGAEFAQAWFDHEHAHWDVYGPLYYGENEGVDERKILAQELGGRRDEMCKHARAFVVVAPAVIEAIRPRVESMMHAHATSSIYFTAALQWTDGRTDTLKNGEEVLALNARHDTFSRTSALAVTIAHELIHDAQDDLHKDDSALPPIARSLYREGAAVFGVGLIFLEVGDGATGMKSEDLAVARELAPTAARELYAVLELRDKAATKASERRFFQGEYRDQRLPPKMGYYLGLQIFRAIAKERGNEEALRIDPDAFLVSAKSYLATAR